MKKTTVTLSPKKFYTYARAVSGIFMATKNEPLTETDVKLIWLLKAGLTHRVSIDKKLRAQIAYKMELKPQTLYNRMSNMLKGF